VLQLFGALQLEYYIDKYTNDGYTGDALWQKIIDSSQKSNPTFDAMFGVK
jgi:hypothetical protein